MDTSGRETSIDALIGNVERVIIGKRHIIELLLVALLSEGHVLLEDVPGTGKTMLSRALARSIDAQFRRIQFTPDVLPSDVTGLHIYNQRTQEFEFRPGPILANVVLADEINRATPRTQSSLLEAMEEQQVTVEGDSFDLPLPFIVLATQNPVELEGTFPLPEAQLDRFMMRLSTGYPTEAQEEEILLSHGARHLVEELQPVIDAAAVLALRDRTHGVHVADVIRTYLTRLVRQTREHRYIELGASPRASLALYRGSQALAFINGRDFVIPDDVKRLAVPILAHRLLLTADARIREISARLVIDEVMDATPVPVEAV